MIPAMSRIRMVRQVLGITLGWLLRGGFLGLPATVGTLLLRLVVRVRLFVVVTALATEKEQNLLRVAGTHIDSFRRWRRAVKRTTLSPISASAGTINA
jgi:hypothetical protein